MGVCWGGVTSLCFSSLLSIHQSPPFPPSSLRQTHAQIKPTAWQPSDGYLKGVAIHPPTRCLPRSVRSWSFCELADGSAPPALCAHKSRNVEEGGKKGTFFLSLFLPLVTKLREASARERERERRWDEKTLPLSRVLSTHSREETTKGIKGLITYGKYSTRSTFFLL